VCPRRPGRLDDPLDATARFAARITAGIVKKVRILDRVHEDTTFSLESTMAEL
jgi:hypothetical protein